MRARDPMPAREVSYSSRRATSVREADREAEATEARPAITIEPAEREAAQDQIAENATEEASSLDRTRRDIGPREDACAETDRQRSSAEASEVR